MVAYSGKEGEAVVLCLLDPVGREWEAGKGAIKVPWMSKKGNGRGRRICSCCHSQRRKSGLATGTGERGGRRLGPNLVGHLPLLKGSNGLQEIRAGQSVTSGNDASERRNQGAVWGHNAPVSSVAQTSLL